jgi:hypothetical protein
MSEPTRFPFHKTYYHPTRGAKADALANVFWPIVMFLLSLSVSLICWGAYNALPQPAGAAEKDLRQVVVPPKFNPDSARVSLKKKAEPVAESELPARAQVSEPPLLPPLPMSLPALPPAEAITLTALEPAPLPTQITAVNPLVYRESTPGDTPMLRNWKTLALCSLLTSAVLVQAPVLADEKAVLEKIDALQESIKKSFDGVSKDMGDFKAEFKKIRDSISTLEDDGVKQRLDLANTNAKVKQIEGALEKIRGEVETLRLREPTVAKTGIDKGSVDDIKAKLGSIEQAILRLQPSTSRVAMSPPAASTTGRVVLVNLYPEELLYLINGKSYRVAPGANVPVDLVPAGSLNYEVISGTWGLRAKNTTTLAPNETFTLTAR